MHTILTVKNVSKFFIAPPSYRDLLKFYKKKSRSSCALKNISFTLPEGKILAILGPNGAGKTTLLKIIAALLLPDTGTIQVNGYTAGKDDKKLKSCIGLLIDEDRSFYWRLNGRQNLDFYASLYGFAAEVRNRRIHELLDLFAVDYAEKRFDYYSTGMKKHFALMRALLHDPTLLLLDEPTKSLDYISALSLKDFIRKKLVQEQGKTVIFTTHHMEETADFADLFMVLDNAQLLAFGTLKELREAIHSPEANLSEIFLTLTKGTHDTRIPGIF